jgi:hypothetical protein
MGVRRLVGVKREGIFRAERGGIDLARDPRPCRSMKGVADQLNIVVGVVAVVLRSSVYPLERVIKGSDRQPPIAAWVAGVMRERASTRADRTAAPRSV